MMDEKLGTLEIADDGTAVLRYLRHYPHPVAAVWRALTDPEQTRLWWAQARGELVPGGRWDLRWLNTSPGEAPMDWWTGSVVELQPERLFVVQNSAHGLLRWELRPVPGAGRDGDEGTELRFSCRLAVPELARTDLSSNLAGWHVHLDHLASVLDGGSIDWANWYRVHLPAWAALKPRYDDAVSAAS